MRNFNLFAFISIVLFSLVIVSCKKDGDNDGGEEDRFGNNLKTGQIEMKGYADKKYEEISFEATAKKITIDWGDGKVDEVTPNGVEKEYSHKYANPSDFQTILINTEDLTYIGFRSNPGSIHEFRLGNVPKLQELNMNNRNTFANLTVLEINKAELLSVLDIERSDLPSLDVSGCTALTEVYCGSNKLTASALNSLFNSLPKGISWETESGYSRTSTIYIHGNPGTDSCDKSIAENKGWKVVIYY
jgi:hypothetical protein